MRKYQLVIMLLSLACRVVAQDGYTISGRVTDAQDRRPLEFVSIYLAETRQWAVTDEDGRFRIVHVPAGKTELNVSCLGYVKQIRVLEVKADMDGIAVSLEPDNLTLNEVVVTAQQKTGGQTTSYLIDRNTLDHAQIVNASALTSLLPGGKTPTDQNLATQDTRIGLHSGTTEMGNATFGTAVTVDGVRLQNNAAMDETKGVDLRNVGTSDIETVEVITGIPSVEYGDLSNGLVKINTRKGKTPLTINLSMQPKTKLVALSKGFALGSRAGTLNASFERTRSTSNLASPFTAYTRNVLTLTYNTLLNRDHERPLSFRAGFTGNVGGYDSEADPDAFSDTYTKRRDNAFRGNIRLNWLLNRPWITNLELAASASYADRLSRVNTNKSSASTQAQIHTMEQGYFIASEYDSNPQADILLSPTGYWYELAVTDSKPLDFSVKLKADWTRLWGRLSNTVMAGAELTGSGNRGRGLYYDDMRYAPTWREYRYDCLPMMHNAALYVEEKASLHLGGTSLLQLTAGLRDDLTFIRNSEYGTVSSLSPRLNARLTLWEGEDGRGIQALRLYGGVGKSVKLPSFEVLYPAPSYADKLAFAPGTMAGGTTFYAYYTIPSKALYNPDLKWQYTRQSEIGVEAEMKWARVSVSAYRNKTFHPYLRTNVYTPYSYNQTTQAALENCLIPSSDRVYTIDRVTGVVTVTDRTGTLPAQHLAYTTRNTFHSNTRYTNGSPVRRMGLDWIVDFAQIPALRTQVRLDGSFYSYKGLDHTLVAWMPSSASTMADGNPYKYVGYYAGSSATSTSSAAQASVSNGSLSRQLNLNLTVTTHVPKIRMIFSVRLESALYSYRQYLSELADGSSRGFALDDVSSYSDTDTDIYGSGRYVAVYPLYYSTWEKPDVRIPFAETFAWAAENDRTLYNELAKLVVKSSTDYYFNANRLSPYFSANINLTKEIGRHVSLSFYATNFFNNMKRVRSSQTGLEQTLYNSGYIPRFYYGMSVRLKL